MQHKPTTREALALHERNVQLAGVYRTSAMRLGESLLYTRDTRAYLTLGFKSFRQYLMQPAFDIALATLYGITQAAQVALALDLTPEEMQRIGRHKLVRVAPKAVKALEAGDRETAVRLVHMAQTMPRKQLDRAILNDADLSGLTLPKAYAPTWKDIRALRYGTIEDLRVSKTLLTLRIRQGATVQQLQVYSPQGNLCLSVGPVESIGAEEAAG